MSEIKLAYYTGSGERYGYNTKCLIDVEGLLSQGLPLQLLAIVA